MPFSEQLIPQLCITIVECETLQAEKKKELENDLDLLKRNFASKACLERCLAVLAAKRTKAKTLQQKGREEKEAEALINKQAGVILALESKIENTKHDLQILEMYISDLRKACFFTLLPEIIANVIQNAAVFTVAISASQATQLCSLVGKHGTLFATPDQLKKKEHLSKSEPEPAQPPPGPDCGSGT